MGALSSSSMGWLKKIGREASHKNRISGSDRLACVPGGDPRNDRRRRSIESTRATSSGFAVDDGGAVPCREGAEDASPPGGGAAGSAAPPPAGAGGSAAKSRGDDGRSGGGGLRLRPPGRCLASVASETAGERGERPSGPSASPRTESEESSSSSIDPEDECGAWYASPLAPHASSVCRETESGGGGTAPEDSPVPGGPTSSAEGIRLIVQQISSRNSGPQRV
mmetsp:Transcript_40382/g.78994  ORF Transcript_40382/g.78994 Transcript_40382/m.78994 type:complete len:223 (-) Transcript_40382:31-699(-)